MPVLGYTDEMQGKLIVAARGLLGIGQMELAQLADVSKPTVISLERDGNPTRTSERKVVEALEAAGIVFEETGDRIGVYLKRTR